MSEASSHELTLSEVGRVLARRWPTIVAATVVCVAAALGAFALTPSTYTATSTVQVTSPASFVRETSAGSLAAETATDVALLSAKDGASVLPSTGASQEVDDAIAAGLDVGSPQGTALMDLSVSASSPELAAEAANVAAERYLMLRTQRATEAREAYLEALEQTDELAAAEIGERKLDATVYGSEVGKVVRTAKVSDEPSSVGVAAYVAAGVLAGLLLGAFVALLRDRRDPKVRTVERLTDALRGATVVAGDLRSAYVGRAVGALALTSSGDTPARVGVVVPGNTASAASLRIVDGLKAAGVAATGSGHGPHVQLVPLPDPSAATDPHGSWWSVAAVVVVCSGTATTAQVTRCAQAAAGAGVVTLGVLSENRAENRAGKPSSEAEAR